MENKTEHEIGIQLAETTGLRVLLEALIVKLTGSVPDDLAQHGTKEQLDYAEQVEDLANHLTEFGVFFPDGYPAEAVPCKREDFVNDPMTQHYGIGAELAPDCDCPTCTE